MSSWASSDAVQEMPSSSFIDVPRLVSDTARRNLDFLEGLERLSSRRFFR